MIIGSLQQTLKHFLSKLISFNSGQLQKNTVNGAMSITINRVINVRIAGILMGILGIDNGSYHLFSV